MSTRIHSAQLSGLRPDIVHIEVDLSSGLHTFTIVGLPDKAVAEARDRITAAIKNSGFRSPQKGRRKVVVSLAPADLKKEGSHFDLAIALGYLHASEDLDFNPKEKLFLGELGLDGMLRPVKGVLFLTQAAKEKGYTEIYVPSENAEEAAIIPGLAVYGMRTLEEVVNHVRSEKPKKQAPQEQTEIVPSEPDYIIDMADVRGQETAKRGLLIAAAGRHNIAMYGPPGTGKTMLARAFTGILPTLSFDELLETTGIHSASGALSGSYMTRPPLRSPHHTSSYVALVGGGANPRPGEITLAHNGVLFLDEFPEFDRRVIEALRGPLEDKTVSVSRARGTILFPANFILIATMNPCPCGNRGSNTKECICSPGSLFRYERKLSGPIIDRIDLWTEVGAVSYEKLASKEGSGMSSEDARAQVSKARAMQEKRFAGVRKNLRHNSDMNTKELAKFAPLTPKESKLLNDSATRLGLSARGYHRIIRLARTIADLGEEENIGERHLLEALSYRPKKQVSG